MIPIKIGVEGKVVRLFLAVVFSIATNFALIIYYLCRNGTLFKLREKEWIWIKETTTETVYGEKVSKIKKKEIQRKKIKEIKKLGKEVVELTAVAVTKTDGVFIEYLDEEELENRKKDVAKKKVIKVIKVSEEDEAATKGMIDAENVRSKITKRMTIAEFEEITNNRCKNS